MDKRKIAYIIPTLGTAGGAERVMSELANYTADNTNIETHLIILTKGEIFYKISQKVIIHQPIFYHKKYSRLVFTFLLMADLRKKVKQLKPDVILSFEEIYSSFVLMATLFLGFHVFVSDRSKPDKDWGFFYNSLRKILYRFAKGIISQTHYSKVFLEKETGNTNIEIIENPIKQIIVNPEVSREKIILNVGRLIRSKKQNLLIEIFAQCPDLSWKLVIVGSGPEKENLISLIRKLEIQERVILIDAVSNIEDFYSISKIFAFTSVSEGYPNTLGEAMSAGLACLSFDCIAGPSELIDDGINGFLIEEENTEKYIDKMILLMRDEELQKRLGCAAKEKVSSLTIDKIATKYLKFLLRET